MPAKSKAQFRFMAAVKHGAIKKKGLSKEEASEFVDTVNYEDLPGSTKGNRRGTVVPKKKKK